SPRSRVLATATTEARMAQAMLEKDFARGLARIERARTILERTYHRCARELRATRKEQVAGGIAVAHYPPHRSVRADFPHTAPTLDDGVRLNARPPAPGTRIGRTVSVACVAVGRSPWSRVFPPGSPRSVALPCSNLSAVLHPSPTPDPRACGPCGFRLLPPVCRQIAPQTRTRSPGSRA